MRNFMSIAIAAAFLALTTTAGAQTADELEAALESPSLSYAAAARFVLEAADTGAPVEPEAAFRFAQDRGWLPVAAGPGDPARLGQVSFLIMRAFKLKGGLFYSLFPSPHYAYRELIYRRVIQDRSDPAMPVSGDQLFFMLGRVLAARPDLTEEAYQ
jgi:hypothetical protein